LIYVSLFTKYTSKCLFSIYYHEKIQHIFSRDHKPHHVMANNEKIAESIAVLHKK